MAEADSRWPEACVQLQPRSYGIYDRSSTGTGFFQVFHFFLARIIQQVLHIHT
jgi:hypothetical protein